MPPVFHHPHPHPSSSSSWSLSFSRCTQGAMALLPQPHATSEYRSLFLSALVDVSTVKDWQAAMEAPTMTIIMQKFTNTQREWDWRRNIIKQSTIFNIVHFYPVFFFRLSCSAQSQQFPPVQNQSNRKSKCNFFSYNIYMQSISETRAQYNVMV